MKKRYSTYFWICMAIAMISVFCALMLWDNNSPTGCAIMCVIAFIGWYAAVMAPDHEKYRDSTHGMTDEAIREKYGK